MVSRLAHRFPLPPSHDAINPGTPKSPKNREEFGVHNVLELFRTQAVHGGLWRCAYKVDSLGEASALIYFASLCAPYFTVIASVIMAVAGMRNLATLSSAKDQAARS